MNRSAWNTAPIRCGKMKCKWRGYEGDLSSVPHPKWKGATQSVCPTCGCDSYMHMTEREVAAWARNGGVVRDSDPVGAHERKAP